MVVGGIVVAGGTVVVGMVVAAVVDDGVRTEVDVLDAVDVTCAGWEVDLPMKNAAAKRITTTPLATRAR